MTPGTLALVRSLGELAAVRIGPVAIRALRKCQRLFEISLQVTLQAIHLRVLSKQRIFCFRVVELLAGRNSFPAARGMACITGLDEGAMVRVRVAIRALAERHARESRRPSGCCGRMALRAGYLRMQAGEGISRFGVIDFCGRLPVHKIVALQAILPELPVVNVLVAGHTIRREPEKCPAQVFHPDQAADGLLNARGVVTLAAFESRVLSLQRVASLVVIEFFERRHPVNERKILAVMLGVALPAVFLVGKMRMQAPALGNFLRDLRVTFFALQYG